MKFAVAKEHRDFFNKNFRIEFNNLFSKEQCDSFLIERMSVVSTRLNISKANFKTVSAGDQFMAGFDLWRGNNLLKKIIFQKNLAEAAADLLEVRSLRIGYDQLIPSFSSSISVKEDTYSYWLSQTTTLQDISSIQGIILGLMICIQAPDLTDNPAVSIDKQNTLLESNTINPLNFFPTSPGNGMYFSPDLPLDLNSLKTQQGYTYLLITYAKGTSVYCKKESDPHTNSFRHLGYSFGDRLSDRYHPLIVF